LDGHRFARSRAAQGAGFGIAAAAIVVALGLAVVARRDADARAARTQARAAHVEQQAIRAARLRGAGSVATRLGRELAGRHAAGAAPLLARATHGRPLLGGATLWRFGGTGSATPVASVAGGLPVGAASLPVVPNGGLDVALLRTVAPGTVVVSRPVFSLQNGGSVVEVATPLRDRRGFVSVEVPAAGLEAAAPAPLAAPSSSSTDDVVAFLLAALALGAVAIVLFGRRGRAVGASRDGVTGLPNRRQLMLDLPRVLAQATEERAFALVLVDLNGFKAYNDRFGHQAGDKLLAHLARRVEAIVDGTGTVYRLGGGEFCVVAAVDAERGEDELVVTTVTALSEAGDGFAIAAACGVTLLPAEATEAAVALRIADQRLYANKQSGRRSAGRQSTDVLLRALSERSPELGSHLHDVAELAGQVGARMGMSDEDIDHLLQAAELHDVGKMAIPDAILKKPGPLDQEEWSFIRGHTVIGERIVAAAPALAPAARLIRSSHERWDGSGYPDKLVGQQIPLGSRIIAVCDAFDAMIGPRPHRLGMTEEEAIGELRRCAGSQFDPEVVRVFAVTHDELTRGGRAAA
jgi:diguanylate cyclase (GGDEF)-like protein